MVLSSTHPWMLDINRGFELNCIFNYESVKLEIKSKPSSVLMLNIIKIIKSNEYVNEWNVNPPIN
jgi:ribosomal protein S8